MKKLPKITQNFLCYEPNMDRSYCSVFPVIFEPIVCGTGKACKLKFAFESRSAYAAILDFSSRGQFVFEVSVVKFTLFGIGIVDLRVFERKYLDYAVSAHTLLSISP